MFKASGLLKEELSEGHGRSYLLCGTYDSKDAVLKCARPTTHASLLKHDHCIFNILTSKGYPYNIPLLTQLSPKQVCVQSCKKKVQDLFHQTTELCQDTPMIHMPYFTGGDLFDWMLKSYQPKPFQSLSITKGIIYMISQCIHDMHECGIVHHDLKLEQFLIDDTTGGLYLTDFESACDIESKTEDKYENNFNALRVISKQYQSPDMRLASLWYTGQAGPDVTWKYVQTLVREPKCDWFSFGVICFILIFGRPPFKRADYMQDRSYYRFWCENKTFWSQDVGASLSYETKLNCTPPPEILTEDLIRMLNGLMDPCLETRWSYDKLRENPWFQECQKKDNIDAAKNELRSKT